MNTLGKRVTENGGAHNGRIVILDAGSQYGKVMINFYNYSQYYGS